MLKLSELPMAERMDMRTPLIQREGRQYRISSALLLMFSAAFMVWQMGVLFYSGTTMSLFGRTPVPLEQPDTTLMIAAGYITSILFVSLFPRKAVYMERVLLPAALAAAVMMLFPLPPRVITWLFYISAFVCVFSIGAMASIAAQHFTLDTVWRDGMIGMAVGGTLTAVLQNELFKIDFSVFVILSILLIAALMVFHYTIPADITVPYAQKGDHARMPKTLFYGLWFMSAVSTLLLCFASSYAESVPSGVSALYLSGAALSAVLLFLRRRVRSVRAFGVFFALSALGFVLAYLSLELSALRLVACVLLGFIVVLANLWMFFAAAAFNVYPTRFIGAMGAGMGLALALVHSGLLRAFRDTPAILFGIYAALSAALMLAYYLLEPYFSYSLRERGRHAPAAAPEDGGAPEENAAEPDKKPTQPHPFDRLSQQERILAGLILAGHTESTISRLMNITLNTQKSYRKNLYAKLEIHSKRELFALTEQAEIS